VSADTAGCRWYCLVSADTGGCRYCLVGADTRSYSLVEYCLFASFDIDDHMMWAPDRPMSG